MYRNVSEKDRTKVNIFMGDREGDSFMIEKEKNTHTKKIQENKETPWLKLATK